MDLTCTCGAPDAYHAPGFELPLCADCWRVRDGRGMGIAYRPDAGQVRANVRGVSEDGSTPEGATEWVWRPPAPTPDAHHSDPIAINGGVGYQQSPPVHVKGVRPASAGKGRAIGRMRRDVAVSHALDCLTPTQADVMRLTSAGFTAREVGEMISPTKSEGAVEQIIFASRRKLAERRGDTHPPATRNRK